MREIKFRAWHPGHPVDGKNRKGKILPWGQFNLEAYIRSGALMQYTGLKDKNGVEIYEGDVLAVTDTLHGTVVWDSATASFKLDSGADHLLRANLTEVIGNIHENPELLTKP